MAAFISYSRKDRRPVEKLAGDLRELNRDTWFDAQIHGGHQWWQSILKSIQGCDLFVVALSRHWIASKACRAEYDYARELKRTIVPVSVKRTAWRSVPASVEALQIVPYQHQDKAAFVELKRAMDDASGPGPLPDPLPADPAPPPRDPPWRLLGAAIATIVVLVAVIAVLLLRGGGGGGGGDPWVGRQARAEGTTQQQWTFPATVNGPIPAST